MLKRICLLLPILALLYGCDGGSPSGSAELSLDTFPFPDISGLDSVSREQILSARADLERLSETGAGELRVAAAYGELGQALQAYGFDKGAGSAYERAARLDPDDFRWPYLAAHLAWTAGGVEEARAGFERARSLVGDDVSAVQTAALYNRLGEIALSSGRPGDARAWYERALDRNPEDAMAWLGLGRAELRDGAPEKALAALKEAARLQPEARNVHYQLGMAYRALGDAERSREEMVRSGTDWPLLVSLDPLLEDVRQKGRNPGLLRERAQKRLNMGDLDRASELYREALELAPDDALTHNNLGAVLLQSRELRAAERHFREALRLDSNVVESYLALAVIHRRRGEEDQALELLRTAEKINPNHILLNIRLARALNRSGAYEEALVRFERVLGTNPANEAALLVKVGTLAVLERREEALALLSEAGRLLPGSEKVSGLRRELEAD